MALSDVLRKLARLIGLYSDDEASYEDAGYDEYPQPEEPYYEEPARQETGYQSGYGSGGSYVRAGAKPKAAPTRRPIEEPTPIQSLFGRRPAQDPRHAQRMDNVIRMPEREERASSFSSAPALERAVGQGKTIIFCVRRKDDSSQIITYLLSGINVILNFEVIDDAQCQRVLDMVSGAAFALSGTVERISHRNYLVAPTGVEIVRSEAELRGDRDRMFLAR